MNKNIYIYYIMGVDENIYIKTTEVAESIGETEPLLPKKKQKKQLSQAQLDGLAKGRKKMAEKKQKAKAAAEENKQKAQEDKLIKRNENKEYFRKIKHKWIKQSKTLKEMREMKLALESIEEDDYDDLSKLGHKLLDKAKNLNKKCDNNINEPKEIDELLGKDPEAEAGDEE